MNKIDYTEEEKEELKKAREKVFNIKVNKLKI